MCNSGCCSAAALLTFPCPPVVSWMLAPPQIQNLMKTQSDHPSPFLSWRWQKMQLDQNDNSGKFAWILLASVVLPNTNSTICANDSIFLKNYFNIWQALIEESTPSTL